MHKSIATIDSPEFINLQPLDINPLMSSCEIKVLYLGENRNHSFITKEVATEMAKTLRGAPIVGYYREEKGDFTDHGTRMIIDDEGVKFECMTTPYGFVAPDAKVWFQTFEDTDEFGNIEKREYLMTTGYLWTGQFEECKIAVEQGRPHSMELDEKNLDGHWATNKNSGIDFFIINDAVFSKLCILGDDVEPCFEGSSVTAPKVSSSFTKMDDEFRKTLFTMMQELQFALKGGQQMENEVKAPEVVEEVVEASVEPSVENTDAVVEPVVETEETTPAIPETASIEPEQVEEPVGTEEGIEEPSVEEPAGNEFKKEEDEKKKEESDDNSDDQSDDEDEEEKKKKNFELLQADFTALQEQYHLLEETNAALAAERDELLAFKAKIEDAEKDAMIEKFCFLSEEDKKDVIENKSKYTLEEIESKLSVICVRNRVNFNLDNNDKTDIKIEGAPVVTFSLNETGDSTPAWIRAVKNNIQK
jgi:hypothetical protein